MAPAVPNDAIVSYNGQDYIFAATGESTGTPGQQQAGTNFERVKVVKGVSDVGFTEVTLLKDLRPKTKIIVRGAFLPTQK